jgi:DNA repair protein RadC
MRENMQCYRLRLVRERSIPYKAGLDGPQVVYDFCRHYFKDKDREYAIVLALDVKNQIIGINVVAVGTLDAALVHPREVFKFAILANASVIIFAHNHPTGNTDPSSDDITLTHKLNEAGELLQIKLLDSIIIGGANVYSFATEKLL